MQPIYDNFFNFLLRLFEFEILDPSIFKFDKTAADLSE